MSPSGFPGFLGGIGLDLNAKYFLGNYERLLRADSYLLKSSQYFGAKEIRRSTEAVSCWLEDVR